MHTWAIACSSTEHHCSPSVFAERKSRHKAQKAPSHPWPKTYQGKGWGSALWGSHQHTPLFKLEVTLVRWFGGQRFYVIWKSGSRQKSLCTDGIVTGNWSVEKQPHSCRNTACYAARCWTAIGMLLRTFCCYCLSGMYLQNIYFDFTHFLFMPFISKTEKVSIQPLVRMTYRMIQFITQRSLHFKKYTSITKYKPNKSMALLLFLVNLFSYKHIHQSVSLEALVDCASSLNFWNLETQHQRACFNSSCWLQLRLSQNMFILWEPGDFQSLNIRSCPVVPIFTHAHVKCLCCIQTRIIPHFLCSGFHRKEQSMNRAQCT